ncbi:MAG: hypothetical protein IPL84_08225 [Chitinophagaceae bacterium]|nr:hypothetical protein [Chitinophagaceae bacterium]
MKRNLFICLLLISATPVFALQDSVIVPIYRQLFHDKIDHEQYLLDQLDGKADGQVRITHKYELNQAITTLITEKINDLENFIELNDQVVTNNQKIRKLSYIENLLKGLRYGLRSKEFNPALTPDLVESFEKIMKADIDSIPMTAEIDKAPYPVGKILVDIFTENSGYADSKKLMYQKFCAINPDKILQTIGPYINEPFADSLVTRSCKFNPTAVYNIAQAPNSSLGKLIHRNTSPVVKTVVALSKTPNALLYFPFLDDLLSGTKTIAGIKKYVGEDGKGYDSIGYFKLLVQTEIAYFKRMTSPARDTAIAMFGANGLREKLKEKAIRHFITPINEQHDLSNIGARMRATDSLSSVDLYYMMVMGENDIYTSSFKHSYTRFLQRLGKTAKTDSLLLLVHFDYFKKFIKMLANFNKLDDFLSYMPKENSETLMRGFIANLDNTGNLEDAIDVADSYSSITDNDLRAAILGYVIKDENECIIRNNKKGETIYGLLKTIFQSADSTNKVDLTGTLGIPSIYEIENKEMQDDSGRIIQQVYWYGDKDGKSFFPSFINSFSPREWIVNSNDEWYQIRSRKGNVWVYANRPLDNDANLDDSAQIHLNSYLADNGLHPSVVVHRGHSYWLPRTIKRMAGNAKIVMLGSCGGFKNLNDIIEVNPSAHIISTKEIGAGDINRPILNYLNQTFESGSTLVWKTMWATLSKLFAGDPNNAIRESWDNYIPPYKNLGAIFLKAYNNMVEAE